MRKAMHYTVISAIVALLGYGALVTGAYLSASTEQTPAPVVVSVMDEACMGMSDVNEALCVIAVTRAEYGLQRDDSLVYVPSGRELVIECLDTLDAEELTYCLLGTAQVESDAIPLCPDSLSEARGTCIYLDYMGTPQLHN